jgi:AcrR family transcriptional regulator
MGKSTFYVYFKNKEELFMECIEQLSVVVVPREAWDEIKREADFFPKMRRRLRAFLKAFSGYSGIINQARMLSGGDDPKLAEKAKETFKLLARPLQRDLQRAQESGAIRKIDSELVAYFVLALGESLGQRLAMDSRHTLEEGIEIFEDFVKYGLGSQSHGHLQGADQNPLPWEVIDIKGVKTTLTELRIDGKAELTARIGEAEVKVELEKICSLRRLDQETACTFEVTSRSGEQNALDIEDDAMLTGRSHLGSFAIPWKSVFEVLVKE